MGFTEITVIVDGVEDSHKIFSDSKETEMLKFIESAKETDGEEMDIEIYMQRHGHPVNEECVCSQYCDGDNNFYEPIWSNNDRQ